MIFVDTNIFYNIFFETELSLPAKELIETPSNLVTSFTVLNELIFISVRKLAEKRYGIKNYFEFRRFIAENGYEPFKVDIDLVFGLINERDILVVTDHQSVDDWREIMVNYRLLTNDALIATTCKYHDIKRIATFDGDFDRVDFLEVVKLDNASSY